MNKKLNCIYCTKDDTILGINLENNEIFGAEPSLDSHIRAFIVYSEKDNEDTECNININYCPFCGKKLRQVRK